MLGIILLYWAGELIYNMLCSGQGFSLYIKLLPSLYKDFAVWNMFNLLSVSQFK